MKQDLRRTVVLALIVVALGAPLTACNSGEANAARRAAEQAAHDRDVAKRVGQIGGPVAGGAVGCGLAQSCPLPGRTSSNRR